MELHSLVRFGLDRNLLDVVLTTLGHHVVVIEGLLANLVDKASLADGWFPRHYHSGSQNRHFFEFKSL